MSLFPFFRKRQSQQEGGGSEPEDSQPPAVFRYFPNARRWAGYTDTPKVCEFCGRKRRVYEGALYGVTDEERICEECLASGALAERRLTTNEGDVEALGRQLR